MAEDYLEEDYIESDLEDEELIEEEEVQGVSRVFQLMQMNNIATEIEPQELREIGRRVIEDYETDYDSLDEWREQNEKAVKLAKQVIEKKSYPWPNASNVKYPLISDAAMQFNARAYPEVIQGDKVVKAMVIGEDPEQQKADRAERISDFMSWQLTNQVTNWETDTDKLLLQLPIVGTMFRESTWDEVNLKPKIDLLLPNDIVVNANATSIELEHCRRISKEVTLFKNDIKTNERLGLWLEIDYTTGSEETEEKEIEEDEQIFIQQIRYLDIDKDGYEEPYIVTVLKESGEVVRIIANYDQDSIRFDEETEEVTSITPIRIYTAYHFIPSFDGSFYSVGFGSYLYAVNMSINTTINQLIDAGTLSNTQGGFMAKGLRQRMGAKRMAPGEWMPIDTKGSDLRNSIVPLPVQEPSQTLFALLQFLVSMGKEMSSITDVMSGVPQGQNTPVGTTLAMIEQGMKVMDAVYKRIYRSLKDEYKILYRINSMYLSENMYGNVLDQQAYVAQDFNIQDMDIVPVGDTRISSQIMRTMKAQATRDLAATTPGADIRKATLRVFEAMDIQNPEEILPEGPDTQQLQQMVEFLQGQVQTYEQFISSGQMQLALEASARENQESDAKVNKDNAQAIKAYAEAEAKEAGIQIEEYKQQLAGLTTYLSEMARFSKESREIEKQRLMQQPQATGGTALGQPDTTGLSSMG